MQRQTLIGLIVLAALCGLGGGIWWVASRTKLPVTIAQPKVVVNYSTGTPSEEPIAPQKYRSKATGEEPKYIKLPTVHAEGYVEAVGLDQHGAVAVPTNINLAGWYANTLVPGQDGLSVIDGHINGRTLPGIFENLARLAAGDKFEVDLANGTVRQFAVVRVSQVPATGAADALFARDNSIVSQLNLITCGGTFDRAKGAYQDRIIVVAKLVQ